jgi:hypothetical protein
MPNLSLCNSLGPKTALYLEQTALTLMPFLTFRQYIFLALDMVIYITSKIRVIVKVG